MTAAEWIQIAGTAMAALAAVAAWRAAEASRGSLERERAGERIATLYQIHDILQSMAGHRASGIEEIWDMTAHNERARRDLRAVLRSAPRTLPKCWEVASWELGGSNPIFPPSERVLEAINEVEAAIAAEQGGR